MTATQIKTINEFVTAFLESNNIDSEQWLVKDNQDNLKKVIAKLGGKASSAKTSKDPNAPKNPKSAYIFFCTDYREKAKQDLGEGAKTTEVTRQLGEMWKSLKEDSKRVKEYNKYKTLAEQDTERYKKEIETYEPAEGFKKKKVKSIDAIKKPSSAYMFFCQDYREEAKNSLGEGYKFPEVSKKLGELWKELKEDEDRKEEMEKYNDMAKNDKDRYAKESGTSSEKKPVATKTTTTTTTTTTKSKASVIPKAPANKPKPGAVKAKPKEKPKQEKPKIVEEDIDDDDE